ALHHAGPLPLYGVGAEVPGRPPDLARVLLAPAGAPAVVRHGGPRDGPPQPQTHDRSAKQRPCGDRRSACGILYHARDAGEVRRLVAEVERPAVAHAAAALEHRDARTGGLDVARPHPATGRLDVQPHALARLEREPGPPVVGTDQFGAVRHAREVRTPPRLERE